MLVATADREVAVTSFTFTAEQIRSAPPEVRLWVENEIAAAFRGLAATPPAPEHSAELAACTPAEALRVFELIKDDFAAAQLFLELGRLVPVGGGSTVLHALSIAEIKRHLRLADDRLLDGFGLINQAFQQVRSDPGAALFGLDQANHVYIHETTYRSIHNLWEELVRLRAPTMVAAPASAGAPPFGFTAPRVGPSEDVAAH